MADEKYTFEQARVRLEEIVVQVRRKDVSLETSIELLEEGVRLANMCTESSDHTEWRTVVEEHGAAEEGSADSTAGTEPDSPASEDAGTDSAANIPDESDSDEADVSDSDSDADSEESSQE